jgi:hypothetical protein
MSAGGAHADTDANHDTHTDAYCDGNAATMRE